MGFIQDFIFAFKHARMVRLFKNSQRGKGDYNIVVLEATRQRYEVTGVQGTTWQLYGGRQADTSEIYGIMSAYLDRLECKS